MNRVFKSAAFALLALLLLCCAAQAEGVPALSFADSQITVYSDQAAKLVVTADAAPQQDITVNIADEKGNAYTVVLAAGKTRATLSLRVQRSESSRRYVYTIQPGDGYAVGAGKQANVLFQGVTMAKFGNEMRQTYLGETIQVSFGLTGPDTLQKGDIIYLRDTQGNTLAEVPYTGRSYYTVSFDMDESWRPMKTLVLQTAGSDDIHSSTMVFVGDPNEISIVGVKRQDNKIAFTMDCGASNKYAYQVLDTLDQYNVKITFFVTGEFARANPDIVRAFVARGHEIGNHTYHHPHLLYAELSTIWNEATTTSDLLESLTGVRPTLYRPPYGDSYGRLRAVIEGAGMKVIRWSHSTNDSDDSDQDPARSYRRATTDIVPGSIILSHLDSSATTSMLPDILQWYQDNGFEVVPVSELLLEGAATVDENGWQISK